MTARVAPDKPAVVLSGSGEVLTYGELEEQANRLVRWWRSLGIEVGDHVAVVMDNEVDFFPVAWAAQRAGLHLTPVNVHLGPDEVRHVLTTSTASLVISSRARAPLAAQAGAGLRFIRVRVVTGGSAEPLPDGFRSADEARHFSGTEPDGLVEGTPMFFSSGTTGKPKGIFKPLSGLPYGQWDAPVRAAYVDLFGFISEMVYLSPAPLYHTAPLMACMAVHRVGGTAVVMKRFDAVSTLEAIEMHRVTHAQFVPAMFVKMLKLDEGVRRAFSTDSLELVLHAAAPCPIDVKRSMIDWWGEVLVEFYSSTEVGMTIIDSWEWLTHPGSVGKAAGYTIHVCDEDGLEVGPGVDGVIWFEGGSAVEYFNDPTATAENRNDRGWFTVGDIGHLDEDGYLYLVDRASGLIIVGGVNVYARQVEDALIMDPAVADVAAVGIDDAELGEVVAALLVPHGDVTDEDSLRGRLIAEVRSRLGKPATPRKITFVDDLPRLPSGKLAKRLLPAHLLQPREV
ncbi:AMP-binding protein [Gordonia terrae]